jgi:hypothetical protein
VDGGTRATTVSRLPNRNGAIVNYKKMPEKSMHLVFIPRRQATICSRGIEVVVDFTNDFTKDFTKSCRPLRSV